MIRCQVNYDECSSNPCRNGGDCVDQVDGYKCRCKPSFYGPTCTQQHTDSNFDFEFGRDTQGYAETMLHQGLREFTIAFWVKAKSEDTEAGTVLSYAVSGAVSGTKIY